MIRSTLSILAAVAVLCLVAACETGEKATTQPGSEPAMGILNDECPISGHPVDPDAPTVSYEGHTIGFCCGGCPARWKEMAAGEKAAFLAEQH